MKTLFFKHLLLNQAAGGDGGAGGAGGAGAVGGAAGGTGAANDWTTGMPEDIKGYAQLKGFKDPSSVIDSYRNLEKHMGAPKERLLLLPEKADDVEGWKGVHARLGRPEKADDYAFTLKPEAGDEKFVGDLKGKFHELGISKAAGEGLMKWYQEHFDSQVTAVQTDMVAKSNAQAETLKKEWGAAHEQNMLIAKKAATAFEVSPEMVDAIQDVVGYDGAIKFLHKLGSKIGEDSFHAGGTGGKGILTPAAAKAAIEEKKRDADFSTRLQSGDAATKKEWDQLNQMAYPSPN